MTKTQRMREKTHDMHGKNKIFMFDFGHAKQNQRQKPMRKQETEIHQQGVSKVRPHKKLQHRRDDHGPGQDAVEPDPVGLGEQSEMWEA